MSRHILLSLPSSTPPFEVASEAFACKTSCVRPEKLQLGFAFLLSSCLSSLIVSSWGRFPLPTGMLLVEQELEIVVVVVFAVDEVDPLAGQMIEVDPLSRDPPAAPLWSPEKE